MNPGAIAAAVLTPLIISYLLKSFPIDLKSEDFPSFETLDKRWGRLYLMMRVIALPLMALGVYLTWLLLVLLADMTAVDTSDAVLVYRPDELMQLLPAIFLGIFFTAAIMLVMEWLFVNKAQLRELIYYQQLKASGNSRKLLGRMAVVLVPVSLLLSLLLADQYAVFQQDKIIINNFTEIGERVYLYDQLTAVETISVIYKNSQTEKETGRKEIVQLVFSGQQNWRTDAGGDGLDSSEEKNQKLIKLLKDKTGLAIIKRLPELIWQD